jgi:mono/diheme cytochrome c family protein
MEARRLMPLPVGTFGGRVALLLIVATPAVGFAGAERLEPSPTPALGQRVFARECSACHTLAVWAPARLPGGSLRGYRMTARQIASFARVMPVREPLTRREIVAVSQYVARRERASG